MTLLARGDQLRRLRRGGPFMLFAAFFIGTAVIAVALVAYLLAPRAPETPVPLQSPALPIVIAGQVFNVPPAAIRIPMQRRAGPQERIDLAYLWPELTPPESHAAGVGPRLFVTIEAAQTTLSPAERLRSVYPRYIDEPPAYDPGGLTVAPFADGTPYQGEDVIYDATAPDRFLVRCSRPHSGPTLAMCLYERPVGGAALTFRFSREWLNDWRGVMAAVDRLIDRWQPGGTPLPGGL
jgi:hypothetical protein